MAKTKFTPVFGSLENLTDKQREDYILAVCEFLQVPSELGLVRLDWMDGGDGARQLLAYVYRGATDIIRERLGISIDTLEEANGEGYVGWKVKAHNKSGRTEMAIGTVSTRGLSGKAAADAPMTAETKAGRRVTLKFAGGGFLDHSEVNEKTTNLASAAIPLSTIAQPTVQPSSAAGKDITPTQPISTNVETAQDGEIVKKRRRRSHEVVLDSPGQKAVDTLSIQVDTVVPVQVEPAAPLVKDIVVKDVVINEVLPWPAPSKVIEGLPSKDDAKMFRDKLFKYTNEILPKAGFVPTEKVGGVHQKMRLFAQIMFPSVTDTSHLTVTQWTHLFTFMDEKVKVEGAEGLVKLIDSKIEDSLKERASNG